MKGCFRRIMRLTLIMLLLSSPLWNSCKEKKTETPPPPLGCGVGTGDFNFNSVGSIDATFDCNTSGYFVINLEPNINSSFIGFNRRYLRLEKAGQIYRSNYVEFSSADENTQLLEWGGSLPSGTYEMRGFLWNIQLNSTCPDNVYRKENKHIGDIQITQFTNPQKVMQIEYFCQDSDTGIIDRYDVFLSSHTSEYMNIAFNIANTRYNRIIYDPDDTNLTPTFVVYTDERIKEYILDHKRWENEMFLCGIKGFEDEYNNFMPNQLGVTYEDNWTTRAPSCSTGSLIAVKTSINYAASDEYIMDYNDLVTAMTIHELGLQRGAVADEHVPTMPYPYFCIGHRSLIHYPSGQQRHHPYLYIRYSNPHFCDQCINGIKSIGW
jgi:hypothetical protein